MEAIQCHLPSGYDIQEPHCSPNALCHSNPSTPPSICSPSTPCPQWQVSHRATTHGLRPYKVQEPPPWICYNCNKPGHIACNCPEPCVHQVCNTDPLCPETIQAIAEAVRIAVRGDTM